MIFRKFCLSLHPLICLQAMSEMILPLNGWAAGKLEKSLMFDLAGFSAMMDGAYQDLAPHRICAYIYQLSNDFNSFYHATRILTEEDEDRKKSWIALLELTEQVLLTCIHVLGFDSPERM